MVSITRITQQNIDKLTVNIHQSICDLNKTKGSESIVVYYAVCALDVIDGYKTGDGHVKFYLDDLAKAMNREAWWVEKRLRCGYVKQTLDSGRVKATAKSLYNYLTIRKDFNGRKVATVLYKSPHRVLIDYGIKDPGSVITIKFNQLTRVQELREITTYGNAQLAQTRSEHKLIESKRGLWNTQKLPNIKPVRKVLKAKQLLEEIKSFGKPEEADSEVSRENQAYAQKTVNHISANRAFLSGINYKIGASQKYIANMTNNIGSKRKVRTIYNRFLNYRDSIYQQYIPVDPYEDFSFEQRSVWSGAMHRILTAKPNGDLNWGLPFERAWRDVVNATDEDGEPLFKGFYITYAGGALECYKQYCNLYDEIYESRKRYKFMRKFNRYMVERGISIDTADTVVEEVLINARKNQNCSLDEDLVNSIEF